MQKKHMCNYWMLSFIHCLSEFVGLWFRESRGLFKTMLSIQDRVLCENSCPLKAMNFFRKMLHLRWRQGSKYASNFFKNSIPEYHKAHPL